MLQARDITSSEREYKAYGHDHGVNHSVAHTAKRPGVTFSLCIGEISKLTTREWEIIGLLSIGLTQAEVCKRLRISESTRNDHLSSIRNAMDASSTKDAVRKAREKGYVV